MHITDFVPPVFIKIVKMIGNANSSGANIFNSYGEAASACVGLGYEQDELINVVFLKTRAYRDWLSQTGNVMLTETMTQSLAGLSLALYARADDEISVLDFGGACGSLYFAMRAALGNKIKLNWHVVDTSAMTRKAKALETDELRFFDNLSTAKEAFKAGIDYFHSSGTIQYVPDLEKTLNEIFASQARFMLLNRLALSSSQKEIVSVQESMLSANGPGALPAGVQDKQCKYPVTYYPKYKLEELIHQKYSVTLSFGETNLNVVDDQRVVSVGYFAELLD